MRNFRILDTFTPVEHALKEIMELIAVVLVHSRVIQIRIQMN